MGKDGNSDRIYFLGLQNHCRWWLQSWNYFLPPLLLGRKAMKKLDSVSKSRDIALLAKVCLGKAVVFPVVMFRCESWTIKKAEHQRTGTFQLWCWRRLLRALGLQGDPTSQPKGNQPWTLTERTDAEAETPIFWSPDVKSWLIRKDPNARKDWGQEEKGRTEDKTVGRHHRLNGHEFQ